MLQIYNKAKLLIIVSLLFFLASCMGDKKEDKPDLGKKKVRKEVNLDKRAEQNASKLRRSGGGLFSGNSGNQFEFSTSNPLWRATMEKLSFAPLGVVDYGGGIIITDWINEGDKSNDIKISVRFLTNEIRSDAINVDVYTRSCSSVDNCRTKKIDNNTNKEIKLAILKRAVEIKNQDLIENKEESGEYKIPGKNF